jgi:hypothetical protein
VHAERAHAARVVEFDAKNNALLDEWQAGTKSAKPLMGRIRKMKAVNQR